MSDHKTVMIREPNVDLALPLDEFIARYVIPAAKRAAEEQQENAQ